MFVEAACSLHWEEADRAGDALATELEVVEAGFSELVERFCRQQNKHTYNIRTPEHHLYHARKVNFWDLYVRNSEKCLWVWNDMKSFWRL